MSRQTKLIPLVAAALLLPLGVAVAQDVAAPAAKKAESKAKKKVEAECEQTSASRIHYSKTTGCLKPMQPTRTYTKEELDSTGQTDVGEALRRLDPRFH
jgi:hypothetical protein